VQGNIYVYVVDQNKKVSTRQITPILRLPNYFILRSGLSATDQVIFEGIQSVKEGDVVETQLVKNPTFS
jgi:membrane fusion protein (multidrug efflux system)